MYLVYLSQDNLSNSNFIKELVYNYKLEGPSLILHEHFGSPGDTRFVTKRISALLSESMVYNTALSGDQRDLLTLSDGLLALRKDLIQKMQQLAPAFVMNALALGPQGSIEADPMQALGLIREQFQPKEVVMFPKNSRSPLVKEKVQITGKDDFERLVAIYDEEEAALRRAQVAAPVTLASPANFAS